jgi:signal transduction histidine kinase/CheY-like chemotaxis protein
MAVPDVHAAAPRRGGGFLSRLKIRHKLLLSYSALLVLVALVGNGTVYLLVRHSILQAIESELETTTAVIAEMVHSSAQAAVRNRLRTIAGFGLEVARFFHVSSLTGLMTEADARREAGELLLLLEIGQSGYIYCLNSQGVLEVHPKEALRGADLSSYAFIQDQIARRRGYLEYEWQNPDDAADRPKALYMEYFEPWDWIVSASSYRTEFASLIEVDDFRDKILALRFGETGYPYVIDGAGNVIIHPSLTGNVLELRDSRGRAFIREICAKRNGTTAYTWQNHGEAEYREKLAVYRYLPELDWIVVAASYSDEFLAPLARVRRTFAATTLVTLLLLVPFTVAVSSTITRPLEQLVGQLRRGAEGDFTARSTIASGDEIGRLARYFNQFMSHLAEAESERGRMEAERSRMAARLRQSEKMEAVGQLAGGMAHDFNNILAAVIGHADLVLGGELTPEARRHVEQIVTAAERATSLTRTLLDFSRKSAVHSTDIDVSALVREVVALLAHSIDKRIAISTDFEDGAFVVRGDAGRLQNTLLNLALNARDAMPDGGRMVLAVRRCSDAECAAVALPSSPEGCVRVAVTDTGVGIDPAVAGRVFEPFFTTKEAGRGTGLGLTSAYGCVRGHGGAIEIRSAPGGGTTVEVFLPLVRPGDAPAPSGSRPATARQSGLALVVDDEDAIRSYAEEALRDLGFEVVGCRDGVEAVEAYAERKGDVRLVLLDLVMPRLDGAQTLERLREIDPEVVVILSSGYPGDTGVGRDMPPGAAAYLAKPYRLDELSRVVGRVLG